MRKKFYCHDSDDTVLALLRTAMRAGVPASKMTRAVVENNSLEDCFTDLSIDPTEFRLAMGHPIIDLPAKRRFFIREDQPEWRLWDDYLRKTTSKGAPMVNFGWYFPTKVPPVDEPKGRSRKKA
jgi:hypothetical protein